MRVGPVRDNSTFRNAGVADFHLSATIARDTVLARSLCLTGARYEAPLCPVDSSAGSPATLSSAASVDCPEGPCAQAGNVTDSHEHDSIRTIFQRGPRILGTQPPGVRLSPRHAR